MRPTVHEQVVPAVIPAAADIASKRLGLGQVLASVALHAVCVGHGLAAQLAGEHRTDPASRSRFATSPVAGSRLFGGQLLEQHGVGDTYGSEQISSLWTLPQFSSDGDKHCIHILANALNNALHCIGALETWIAVNFNLAKQVTVNGQNRTGHSALLTLSVSHSEIFSTNKQYKLAVSTALLSFVKLSILFFFDAGNLSAQKTVFTWPLRNRDEAAAPSKNARLKPCFLVDSTITMPECDSSFIRVQQNMRKPTTKIEMHFTTSYMHTLLLALGDGLQQNIWL